MAIVAPALPPGLAKFAVPSPHASAGPRPARRAAALPNSDAAATRATRKSVPPRSIRPGQGADAPWWAGGKREGTRHGW